MAGKKQKLGEISWERNQKKKQKLGEIYIPKKLSNFEFKKAQNWGNIGREYTGIKLQEKKQKIKKKIGEITTNVRKKQNLGEISSKKKNIMAGKEQIFGENFVRKTAQTAEKKQK